MSDERFLTTTVSSWVLLEYDSAVCQWVSHALELDVISQGATQEEAVRMVVEAMRIVVAHDWANGLDWTQRRAPREEWKRLEDLMARGKIRDARELMKSMDLTKPMAVEIVVPMRVWFESMRELPPQGEAELALQIGFLDAGAAA